jgi:Na+-transporting NADH:ubiquinone oxidoreductase subunit NqrB
MILQTKFPAISRELSDPRYFQILFLFSFISFGMLYLGWAIYIRNYAVILSTALSTQIIFAYLYKKPFSSVKSALITSFGLCMLLKGSDTYIYVLAPFIAISGKFLITYRGKHLFNPANLGIVACLVFTDAAWVSPGQWGSDVVLVFFMGVAGLTVLLRVGRLDTALAFILTLIALQYLRQVWYLGWTTEVLWHKFSSGTLLLFTFFMITDPMTIPDNKKARVPWAMMVAILTFILSTWYFSYAAAIWALFILSPLTVILDRAFKAPKFEWLKPQKTSTEIYQSSNLKAI